MENCKGIGSRMFLIGNSAKDIFGCGVDLLLPKKRNSPKRSYFKRKVKLTAKTVRDLYELCLVSWSDEENYAYEDCGDEWMREFEKNTVFAFGVNDRPSHFYKDKLEEYEEAIISCLEQLPIQFREESGGIIKDARKDKRGFRWGNENDVVKLIALGAAINKVKQEKDSSKPVKERPFRLVGM